MEYRCPECQRPISNRKISNCLYCGATLPKDLLFSPEEVASLKKTAELERREHKEFMKKRRPKTYDSGTDLMDAGFDFDFDC